jgi:hypothetical protein
MPSYAEVRRAVYQRSGGRCECRRSLCSHPRVAGGERCTRTFSENGRWELHRLTAGEDYTASGCQALCEECHEQTRSFGRG